MLAALKSHLEGDSAITALVSTRIYAEMGGRSATVPYLRLFILNDASVAEYIGGDLGSARAVMQIDIVASTAVQRETIYQAIRARCHMDVSSTWGTAWIKRARIIDRRSDYDPPRQGGEQARFIFNVTLEVTHTEPEIAI